MACSQYLEAVYRPLNEPIFIGVHSLFLCMWGLYPSSKKMILVVVVLEPFIFPWNPAWYVVQIISGVKTCLVIEKEQPGVRKHGVYFWLCCLQQKTWCFPWAPSELKLSSVKWWHQGRKGDGWPLPFQAFHDSKCQSWGNVLEMVL